MTNRGSVWKLSERVFEVMRGTKTIIERMDEAERIKETNNQLMALTGVTAERDRLKAELEKVTIERDEARVAVDFANLACDRKQIQLDKSQAACAVMREALIPFQCETCNGTHKFKFECDSCLTGEGACKCSEQPEESCPQCQSDNGLKEVYAKLEQALSTDCGTALLARLKELEGEVGKRKLELAQQIHTSHSLQFELDETKTFLANQDATAGMLRHQLHARDTALLAARVALCLAAGISAVRSDKKLDHQIKEAKEASVSAIEQIDAACK